MHTLNNQIWFPPVSEANSDGLLAIGGDLKIERLLLAYQSGIFPWFEGTVPLWWSPDPRCILFPEKLKISKSMQSLIKKNAFRFSINEAFQEVLQQCQQIKRIDQEGTWITFELIQALKELHNLGFAHSAEVWEGDQLIGGLYGIKMGKIFFGESMFSHQPNASKYAFIKFVEELKKEGIKLIDCQVYTNHLTSLGAEMMPRNAFIQILEAELGLG